MESRALKDDKVRAGTLAKKASPFIVRVVKTFGLLTFKNVCLLERRLTAQTHLRQFAASSFYVFQRDNAAHG
jgi:hypothetical protein